MNNDERISYVLKNTRFIFRPNLSGDPSADKYGSTTRKATIVVPDSSMVEDMLTRGINVKLLPPRDETEEPVHFVTAIANFDSRIPPRIYLVSGNNPARLLNEETVGEIDNVYVLNVNASLNPWFNEKTGKTSLYIRTMYVELEVEDDPFAGIYAGRGCAEEDCIPFS